jgi:hypothetical protein
MITREQLEKATVTTRYLRNKSNYTLIEVIELFSALFTIKTWNAEQLEIRVKNLETRMQSFDEQAENKTTV